jgi:hypothetical protein
MEKTSKGKSGEIEVLNDKSKVPKRKISFSTLKRSPTLAK